MYLGIVSVLFASGVYYFPSTSQLSKTLNMHRSAISRAILELEKKGLIRCLSPMEKRGRFYQITKKGKDILNNMGELNIKSSLNLNNN